MFRLIALLATNFVHKTLLYVITRKIPMTIIDPNKQESQYYFPYHYLARFEKGVIKLDRHLQWGLVHASYTRHIANLIADMNAEHILDAGCGDGRMVYEISSRKPSCNIVGIDISERALHFARGFNFGNKATFKIHDITAAPLTTSFDLCLSMEVIEHIAPSEIPAYIKNIALSLKPGGTLVISTPTTNLPLNKKHYQHFTKESLSAHLKDHFTITDILYLNHEGRLANYLSRAIANKFFILRGRFFRSIATKLYMKYCFTATEQTGSRIVIIANRK